MYRYKCLHLVHMHLQLKEMEKKLVTVPVRKGRMIS